MLPFSYPLTELLKKDSFLWTPTTMEGFNKLKLAITHAPILSLPDLRLPFTLETDSSGSSIGVVLS